MKRLLLVSAAVAAVASVSLPARAEAPGLLFRYSADHGLGADFARGEAEPNFADKVKVVPGGPAGPYLQAEGDQVLSWQAPGNIYAQRGTLSFLWRAREPLGRNEFPIFRVGYADHTSWDMTWLRIDWNGHGFDAFVTDAGLARTRVSWTTPKTPTPEQWMRLTFTWDEAQGVRLYVDGKLAARLDRKAVYDAGLDQLGPHSRIIGPHQVQSLYSYRRGGDIDEIRIYDRALDAAAVASLAQGEEPTAAAAAGGLSDPAVREAWLTRYGWNRAGDPPPYLDAPSTRIRKVEFTDARDLKERMTGANDGIAETTWPGVYNRSRLPGRHDYFELPDWNVYAEGGEAITFSLPDEPWNRLEVQGAAAGAFSWTPGAGGQGTRLAERAKGQERTWSSLPTRQGGKLRFDNAVKETPLQEVQAFDVTAGEEPAGGRKLAYTVRAGVEPGGATLAELNAYVAGRFPAGERATVVALPEGAPAPKRTAPLSPGLPIVHVLIPEDFRDAGPGQPVGHFSYGWRNLDGGLDGIAIDIPALAVTPTHGGLIPLNIQIKDPIWPGRNLIDVSVSVKPGEARTVFLDTRDRLLPNDKSLYLSIASASPDFSAVKLDGAKIRLVFKDRAAALPEHVTDRFAQARDNMAFLVEEHTNTRRLSRYARLEAELTDLLRADPNHEEGRLYWSELNPEQGWPAFTQPTPPAGVPLWAFRQVEDLKLVHRFVNWWIDERQVAYGDFGGGISDDDDLTQQWPPLALMGVEPDKIRGSLRRLVDAVDANGMITNGLGTIRTDELHSYEEGINARSEAMYLDWGDPKTVERLMQTAGNYGRITETNAAGHRHVTSNYFSGTDVVREGPWGWSKPYSYLILHPGLLLVEFNGDPQTKALILGLADSHLAHGKQGADGSWSFPADINSGTDAVRGVLTPAIQGGPTPLQIFWAAYRWTGDEKYLRPLAAEMGGKNYGLLSYLNENTLDLLGKRNSWGAALAKAGAAEDADDFARFVAWQTTGDKRPLEALYGHEIQTASQRMYMVTEGHWWSDRVELFSDLLQRSRLGGMALRRNQIFPGHTVSWRFDAPEAAEQVAILVENATPTRFKVVAYNLSDRPVSAAMTGWDVAPGTWRQVSGVDRDGDDRADGETVTKAVALERSASVPLTFAPRQTSVFEFELDKPGAPTWDRPDLGIGRDDVRVERGVVKVRVHSLGARDAASGEVTLEDGAGRIVARAAVPALKAPKDLQPKTVDLTLHVSGTIPAGGRVRVRLADGAPEVTRLNNEVVLP